MFRDKTGDDKIKKYMTKYSVIKQAMIRLKNI